MERVVLVTSGTASILVRVTVGRGRGVSLLVVMGRYWPPLLLLLLLLQPGKK